MIYQVIGFVEGGEAVVLVDDRTVMSARAHRAYQAIADALFGWLP